MLPRTLINPIIIKGLAITLAGILITSCTRSGSSPSEYVLGAARKLGTDSLTDDEKNVAAEISAISVAVDHDMAPRSFNNQNWPLPCSAVKDPAILKLMNDCPTQDGQAVFGLRAIHITGLILVVDNAQWPWNALNGNQGILSLDIEA